MECYVFIDNSNIWIEGQKAQAEKLKDATKDPRFRVEYGKLLELVVTNERHIVKATLYGSKPPPNDTVWAAIERHGIQSCIFERSAKGKEKEVDSAMVHGITKTLYKDLGNKSKDEIKEVVFIIVTGDRDFMVPIEDTLDNEVRVELWSWNGGMASKYKKLAKKQSLFTANSLNERQYYFSNTVYHKETLGKINKAHAIVWKDIPMDEAEHIGYIKQLKRLFYYTTIIKDGSNAQQLVVEFPNTEPQIALQELRDKFPNIKNQLCDYAVYGRPCTRFEGDLASHEQFPSLRPTPQSTAGARKRQLNAATPSTKRQCKN